MKTRTLASLLAVTAALAVALSANAQSGEQTASGLCPDFGESSVIVALAPFSSKAAAGAFLPVDLLVTNLKDYPLSGGTILTRLLSVQPADRDLSELSGAVLARSTAIENVFLAPRESKSLSFMFALPATLPKGEYVVEAVYSVSGTAPDGVDEAPGRGKPNSGFATLSIDGKALGGFAYVDPKTISVDETEDGGVSVSVDVVNAGRAETAVPLLWKAYYGNATREASAIAGSVETVRVPASGKARASYRLSDTSRSSYSILAAAASGGVSSYAAAKADGVRGGAVVRLLGIAPWNDGWQAFGCIENAFTDDEEQRLVSLIVTDGTGTLLGTREFAVGPGQTGVEMSVPFAIQGTGDVIVAAEVASGGLEKERYENVFRCGDLGTCAAPAARRASPSDALLFSVTMLLAGVGGIVSLLLRPKKPSMQGSQGYVQSAPPPAPPAEPPRTYPL